MDLSGNWDVSVSNLPGFTISINMASSTAGTVTFNNGEAEGSIERGIVVKIFVADYIPGESAPWGMGTYLSRYSRQKDTLSGTYIYWYYTPAGPLPYIAGGWTATRSQ